MQTQFHIRGLNLSSDSRRCFEQSLGHLQSQASATAAAVVLEHRRDGAPAFRAYVALAVPGPDFHAEARDHTLQAAWLKALKALSKQIEQRKSQQQARVQVPREARPGPRRAYPFLNMAH